jgi:alpha-beta hydrolase superfamily lysophospholipase
MHTQTTQFLHSPDHHKIALHSWIPQGEIRYIIQLSHGMIEYAKRYDHFGIFLCNHQIALYGHDHRGHGESVTGNEILGSLSEENGFDKVINDLYLVTNYIKKTHPGKIIFLLGHSFGSFISQAFIEQHGKEIDGCLLSGTAGPRHALVKTAKGLSFIIKKIKGNRYKSKLMNNLAFGNYNRKIDNPQSKNAWLTRDPQVVEEYDRNPYTTFMPTIGFFYDLFSGLSRIHLKKNMELIPKNLPVLLFTGKCDPVGNYGKTVKDLYKIYQSIGIKDVSLILYSGGRHEMLNETNKEEVMKDILKWMEIRLTKHRIF